MLWIFLSLAYAQSPARDDVSTLLSLWIYDDAQRQSLLVHLDEQAAAAERDLAHVGPSDGIAEVLYQQVAGNLRAKQALAIAGSPVPMTMDDLEVRVIDWEAWRLVTYVNSGVYPRRYFGYVDDRGDTAEFEKRLRVVVPKAVREINAWQAEHGDPLRVTDAEVTVTFLAECGALYLRDRTGELDTLHPVFSVGLDDVALGSSELPGLQDRLDAATGTQLGALIAWSDNGDVDEATTVVPATERWLHGPNDDKGPYPYLKRYMTFEEGVVGTALMWLWEKEIAAKKVAALDGIPAMHTWDLDDQFIAGSLVYNSGTLHSPATWKRIRTFSSGDNVYETSERNAARRPRLPVLPPKQALAALLSGQPIPDQPTSWLGVYHILQRYGGYVGLQRYTHTFNPDGSFAEPPAAPPPEAFPTATTPSEPASSPGSLVVPPPDAVSGAEVHVDTPSPQGCGASCVSPGSAAVWIPLALLRRRSPRRSAEPPSRA